MPHAPQGGTRRARHGQRAPKLAVDVASRPSAGRSPALAPHLGHRLLAAAAAHAHAVHNVALQQGHASKGT